MKATRHIMQPHSQEWYLSRLSKFSSSEVFKLVKDGRKKDAIFSDTALSYIYEKVAETMSNVLPESVTSASLEWGILHESEAIMEFERQFQQTVQTGTVYHLDDTFCGTPDGETPTHILEVKCPYNSGNHIQNTLIRDAATLKEIRVEYYWQVQMNMWLSGKSKAYFISFDPRQPHPVRMHVVEIDFNEEDVQQALTKISMASEFKYRMIANIADQYIPKY